MTDLPQHQTTSSGSRGNQGRYPLDLPPLADHVSFNPAQVGQRFGWVEILTSERRYTRGWSGLYVAVRCVGCGASRWTCLSNLKRGISSGCQSCSQPRTIPLWLDRRLTAAKQRCENPSDQSWKNYGARGLRFGFNSVTEAGLWVVANLGLPDRKMELDRIDNNKGYEPGNLRWATRQQNTSNTRKATKAGAFHAFRIRYPHVRYADNTLRNLLGMGLTMEQIAARWEKPSDKPKGVYGTFSTPDPVIALQYQGD